MDAIRIDDDIVAWSKQQADALRRRASNELDWDTLASEIEDIGMGALEAIEGLLYQALSHQLKIMAWPQARDVQHWHHEYLNFLGQAQLRYRPAWRQKIDLAKIYRAALRHQPETMYGALPQALPDTCPWTLEELLQD